LIRVALLGRLVWVTQFFLLDLSLRVASLVDGQRLSPRMNNKEENSLKEWIVPLSLTQDGKISVTFDGPEESDLNWRKNSKISDVWLLKE